MYNNVVVANLDLLHAMGNESSILLTVDSEMYNAWKVAERKEI
jgi:hypothetical protein